MTTPTRTIIRTDRAPKALGPYSQAVRSGDNLYLSGQVPLDPATGKLVDGDISAQARRVFDNLRADGSRIAPSCCSCRRRATPFLVIRRQIGSPLRAIARSPAPATRAP